MFATTTHTWQLAAFSRPMTNDELRQAGQNIRLLPADRPLVQDWHQVRGLLTTEQIADLIDSGAYEFVVAGSDDSIYRTVYAERGRRTYRPSVEV